MTESIRPDLLMRHPDFAEAIRASSIVDFPRDRRGHAIDEDGRPVVFMNANRRPSNPKATVYAKPKMPMRRCVSGRTVSVELVSERHSNAKRRDKNIPFDYMLHVYLSPEVEPI